MFGKFNQNDEYQQPWLNMCNPEIWINLNLPKLYNNYLKPVPRLWDLGIGNFTPSAFPGFEWVRNNKVKQIYWRFQKPPCDQSHFASLGSIMFRCRWFRSEAVPCTKGKSTQKLHVRPKQSTTEIWLKALKTFQYPPSQCHLVWVCLLGPSQPGVVTGTASLRFQSAYHI